MVAFGRNIGWITREEQTALRAKRVAIAGAGGVGGAHAVTLARLGIERFTIADPDEFELANFNRQTGATMKTLGRPKATVMAELTRDINPGADVRVIDDAIGQDDVGAFLEDADLCIDSLDVFALDARRALFAACRERGIPAISAAPLGMSAAQMVFLSSSPSFEDYFRLDGHPREEQLLRFLVGMAPASLQRFYLVDPGALVLAEERVPSTAVGIALAAGLAATTALKLLLGRGPILAAPWGVQFDAYSNRLRRTWRPGGNANPLSRFTIFMARRALRRNG